MLTVCNLVNSLVCLRGCNTQGRNTRGRNTRLGGSETWSALSSPSVPDSISTLLLPTSPGGLVHTSFSEPEIIPLLSSVASVPSRSLLSQKLLLSSPVLVSNSLNQMSTLLRLVEKIDVTSAAQRGLFVTRFAMVAI